MSCVVYLCCLVVAGYPVVGALARRRSWVESAGLCLCMGPGVVGICLIFLSMLGVRPSWGVIAGLTGLLAAAGVYFFSRKRTEDVEIGGGGPRVSIWWAGICVLAMVYGMMAVTMDAVAFPVIEWDAFAIWQLKAQVLALYPLHPRPEYFSNLNLSYSHLRYPLLVPMMSAGMHAMTGRLDDLGKTISLLMYPGMLAVVYAAVRRINGTTAAFASAALVACLMPMLRYGGSGTAEMSLTAFYACSLLCLLRWLEKQEWGYLILAAMFSAWMTWTKNEGLALAAINVVVVATMGTRRMSRRSLVAAAWFAAIVAVIYAPWVVFSWGLPRTDEDYAGKLNALEILRNFRRLPTIFRGIGQEMALPQDWGIFWLIVVALAIIQRRQFRHRAVALMGVLLGLHLLAYVPPLMVTNWKLEELMSVSMDRLLMHAAPAGAILIGLLWPEWAGGKYFDRECARGPAVAR